MQYDDRKREFVTGIKCHSVMDANYNLKNATDASSE